MFLVALVLVLSAVASLSFASAAGAATKCGQKVLADWYDNGRIDKLYPLNCYEEAIDAIPDDIGPYVDAEDVITRALQGAMRNELDPGGCDPTADGSTDDCKNQGGNGKSGNGSRQSGVWVLDQFTRWQAMNWDYSGRLQKAQMDVTDIATDPGFRLDDSG